MRTVTLTVLLAAVVAACVAPASSGDVDPSTTAASTQPSTSPEASAAPSSTPSAVPTTDVEASPSSVPRPTVPPPPPATPPADLERTATVEKDGVRVRITLERNPMPAGEWTRVVTSVKNLGSDDLTWFHDGCATLVYVYGEMEHRWRPGIDQSGVAKTFKDRVLDLAYRTESLRGPIVNFVPEDRVSKGGYGCADLGISEIIGPGKTKKAERVWDGTAALHWGPPPTGPVRLTASFGFYWRGTKEPANIVDRTIELELDSFVTGGADATWLSPPEVVDAALADAAFLEFLGTQDMGNGREEILWYRPELDAWEVGILAWNNPERQMHLVHVDPRSGEVLATVDRPWDEEADGFP